MSKVLLNSGILDTETFGIERGSGVNQMAWYDLDTNNVQEWRVSPHLARYANKKDEVSRLADYSRDPHYLERFSTWDEAKKRYSALSVLDQSWMESYYAEQHRPIDPTYFSARNIGFSTSNIDVTDVPGVIKSITQGKTVWIANAAFESKQIGAITAALGDTESIREHFETQGRSDPLFVTGSEVNAARAKAAVSGDWTQVWESYVKHTPKPGETAVRDIQDILRAMMSYGKKAGLIDFNRPYFGTAIDVTSRLFALTSDEEASEVIKKILDPEVHVAAKDVYKEAEVLRKAAHYTDVLHQVTNKTPQGLEYVKQASSGKGAFYEIGKYFEGLKAVKSHLEDISVLQRFDRAKRDLEEHGVTEQVVGQRVYARPRTEMTPSGTTTKVDAVEQITESFTSLDEVADLLNKQNQYDKTMIARALETAKNTDVSDLAALVQTKRTNLESFWTQRAGELAHLRPNLRKAPAIAPLAIGLAIMYSFASGDTQKVDKRSEYDMYLARHHYEEQQHKGVNAELRPLNTDFGSPYKGSEVSQGVIADTEMLRQREKFLNQQYGAMVYEPDLYSPVSRLANKVKTADPRGYRLFSGGTDFGAGEMPSVYGAGRAADVSNWYIEPEDADTFRLYEPGVAGFVRKTLGLEPYKFRIAGIDAPETSHQYKAQPFGYEAKSIFEQLLAGRQQTTVVYNPSDTTYGRSVGTLIIDGKNVSEELINKGAAAALSYEKGGRSLLSYSRLRALEDKAREAHRGMWNEPYFETVRNYDPHGDIPFNRLINPEKYGGSSYYQEIVGAAEFSQKTGQVLRPSYLPDDVNMGDNPKPSRVSSKDFHHNQLAKRMQRQNQAAASQRAAIQKMKESPINHHRM